jgi:hypothetical protein
MKLGNMRRVLKNQLFWGWILLWGISSPSVWADISREQVEPKHVLIEAQRVQHEISLIRDEMGKPKPPQLEIKITNAQPREVFFQALTLYQKADRMCFDHTRNTGPIPPQMKQGKILPGDVLEVLKKAMNRIHCVSDHWEITKSLKQPISNPYTVSSDVYMEILEVNRELNFLLDVPYSPSTVYRHLQETVQLVEFILRRNDPEVKLPSLPEFIRGKHPRDVYLQNQRCLVILQRISIFTGNPILKFFVEDESFQIEPGDVFDLVSLLLSEVKYIDKKFHPSIHEKTTQAIPFSGRKFPSHVFQKAVYLEKLLLQWESEMEESLDWEFEYK